MQTSWFSTTEDCLDSPPQFPHCRPPGVSHQQQLVIRLGSGWCGLEGLKWPGARLEAGIRCKYSLEMEVLT